MTIPRIISRRPLVAVVILYVCILVGFRFISPSDSSVLPRSDVELEVSGQVTGDPDVRISPDGIRVMCSFPFKVDEASRGGNIVPLNADVRVFWYGREGMTIPKYGDTWTLLGVFRKSSRLVPEINCYKSKFISEGHGSAFVAGCYNARRKAAGRLSAGIEDQPQVVGIVNALLLGYRMGLDRDMRDVFMATGTLHIFAISGLHVGIISMLIILGLSLCRVSRVNWVFYIAPVLAVYTYSTGMKASAVRACIMVIIYYLAPFLRRKADAMSAVAMSALLILIFQPSQLFDVGFIYSFVVVIGLVFLYPVFEAPLIRLLDPDPLIISSQIKRGRFAMSCRKAGKYVCSLIAVSCSAWLVSMPLTAYFFQRFTVMALLSNLVVIPLAFIIVLCGCLSITVGSCIGLLGLLLNKINVMFTVTLITLLTAIGKIPPGSLVTAKPHISLVLLWYCGLVVGGIYFRAKLMDNKSKKRVSSP